MYSLFHHQDVHPLDGMMKERVTKDPITILIRPAKTMRGLRSLQYGEEVGGVKGSDQRFESLSTG